MPTMKSLERSMIAVLFVVATVGALPISRLTSPADAQTESSPDIDAGRRLFNTYCASCHGTTGIGNGPVSAFLRRTPPDITGLSLANGGVFPNERLGRIIDGREIKAHGNRDMPVWGDAFKAMPGGYSEESVKARIMAVLVYLRSIERHRG